MFFRDEESKNHVRFLLDVVAGVANDTRSASMFTRIPEFLVRVLNIPSVSLAIVRNAHEGAAILLSAFSGTSVPPSFERELLDIHHQTPLAQDPANLDIANLEAGSMASFPRATVFSESIDQKHRLLLIVHQRGEDAQLPANTMEMLKLLSRQLCRMLEPLVIWLTKPQVVGAPFEHLTEREWIVLRHLDSDAGEKQIADQLGLSPHTLHSHIKSIYRKVGVQGRLQLLKRVEESVGELRRNFWVGRLAVVTPKAAGQDVSAA
jgi:DNA-binding CsgD family transcriptional regulator